MKRILGLLALLATAPSLAPAQQGTTRLVAMASSPADSARDQAIAKLEAFLSRYPASDLRPNAPENIRGEFRGVEHRAVLEAGAGHDADARELDLLVLVVVGREVQPACGG